MFRLRSILSTLAALLAGAPRGSLCLQVSKGSPLFSATRWANRFPLAYALLLDLGSLPQHILEMHETGMVYNGLDLQRVAGGCRVGSDEYQSRIEGIQNLKKIRPYVGLWESLLFLEGFRAGVAFRDRNDIPRSPENPSPDSTT